jgi:hypothetical protein
MVSPSVTEMTVPLKLWGANPVNIRNIVVQISLIMYVWLITGNDTVFIIAVPLKSKKAL